MVPEPHRSTAGRSSPCSLVVFHFAMPFLILLNRRVEAEPGRARDAAGRDPRDALRRAVLADLAGVHPPARGRRDQHRPSWMDLAAPFAIGGIWVGIFLQQPARATADVSLQPTGAARPGGGVGSDRGPGRGGGARIVSEVPDERGYETSDAQGAAAPGDVRRIVIAVLSFVTLVVELAHARDRRFTGSTWRTSAAPASARGVADESRRAAPAGDDLRTDLARHRAVGGTRARYVRAGSTASRASFAVPDRGGDGCELFLRRARGGRLE